MLIEGGGVESAVESGYGAVLESPKPEALARSGSGGVTGANPRRKRNRLNRRTQFSLLIVRGDGVRVLRFNFIRPTAIGAGVALAAVACLSFALVSDWLRLRDLTREAVTFQQQIHEQQATIDSFNTRVAEVRREMAGWRDLHARIWEPFGPERAPGGRDKGIGGGTPTPDATSGKLSPPDEPGFVARLRIFNPDGSEAELSGNGAREAIMYLRRAGWTDAATFSIQTAAGEIRPTITGETTAQVDMGRAAVRSADYPGGPDDVLGGKEDKQIEALRDYIMSLGRNGGPAAPSAPAAVTKAKVAGR